MRRHLPKVISTDEAERLLSAPNVGCPTGLRNRCALELMYRAGLRVSEVVNLKAGDIRWQTGEMVIRGKGDKDRVVPLENGTLNWLRLWNENRPKRAKTFLCTLKGGPVSARYLEQMVDRCTERASVDKGKVSPHVLRHTYATSLLDEGFTLREVQDLLGHASVQTTQVYTHVNPKALREKIQARGNGTKPESDETVMKLAKALAGLSEEQRKALQDALAATRGEQLS